MIFTFIQPETNLEYASRLFEKLAHISHTGPAYDDVFPAFFVLDRYSKQRPDDATGLHLFGLVCERLGQIDLGIDLIQRAISILEAVYEETEDPIVEQQFTIANSSLARLKLSAFDYEGALESFESALGLISEDSIFPSDIILRAQAQFGSGLAQFKLGNLEEALSLFEAALESAGDNILIRGQATVLLAQTMWAIGTDEFRESAKAQLLEWYDFTTRTNSISVLIFHASITTDSENLNAINALAGMGILTDDDNLVDAALSEILSLPAEKRHELDPGRDVDYLLIQHHLGQVSNPHVDLSDLKMIHFKG
jgi:superkiller protein 3